MKNYIKVIVLISTLFASHAYTANNVAANQENKESCTTCRCCCDKNNNKSSQETNKNEDQEHASEEEKETPHKTYAQHNNRDESHKKSR